MWPRVLKLLKRNVFWIALLAILLIPQIRMPFQVILNRAFAHINLVSIEKETKTAELHELILITEDGSRIVGEELKGKVLFVNLWATWCPPCIAEMPSIQKLYTDYADRVTFLLVSNEPFEKTDSFKNSKNYNFEVFRPEHLPDPINGRSIPRTLIIHSNGNVVVEKTGSVDWNSQKIRDLLDSLLEASI